jgi:adenine phosphoribosyltransferase
VNQSLGDRIAAHVQEIADFPKPGLRFRDITPILADAALFRDVVDAFAEEFKDREVELICGIEARGFMFSAALAYRLGKGMIPIRWPGKLPPDHQRTIFELEYGFDALTVHKGAFAGGRSVLLVDDLLATGSTLRACTDLVRQAGGHVLGAGVVVEIPSLEGRLKLADLSIHALAKL